MPGRKQRRASRSLSVKDAPSRDVVRGAFTEKEDLRESMSQLARLHGAEARTREIIQKYQAAMREMKVRFEIIDQDLSLKKHRNPIHHIESRIKKPASIFEKLERYGKEPTLENMEKYIMDIAGVRVICSYIHDVYNLLELLRKQDDLAIVTVKDYIKNPKPNGYRSLHLILEVPIFLAERTQPVRIELQIRTMAMDFWASLEHQLRYKSDVEIPEHMSDDLKKCADVIAETDQEMQRIAKELKVL